MSYFCIEYYNIFHLEKKSEDIIPVVWTVKQLGRQENGGKYAENAGVNVMPYELSLWYITECLLICNSDMITGKQQTMCYKKDTSAYQHIYW